MYLHLRLTFLNDTAASKKLQTLEQENGTWAWPSYYLAIHYSGLSAYDTARKHLETGLSRVTSLKQKVSFFQTLAAIDNKSGTPDRNITRFYDLETEVEENSLKAKIFETISQIYDALNDEERSAKALEQCLKNSPDDKDIRFSLAYKYSGSSLPQLLSLYHYEIANTQVNNNSFVSNNLGAFYDGIGIKSAAVNCWKHASENGNQRAIGNLALLMIKAGFYDDAREKLNSVSDSEDLDTQIISAWTALNKAKSEDDEKKLEIIASSKKVHQFFTRNLSLSNDENSRKKASSLLKGIWTDTEDNFYTFDYEGGKFIGEYQSKISRFSITGNMLDSCAYLTLTKTHTLRSTGLGLLFLPNTDSDKNPQNWETVSLLRAESYNIYLQTLDETHCDGIKVTDTGDIEQFTLIKNLT